MPWPPLSRGRVALRPWGATPKDSEFLAAAWAEADIARFCKVPDDHGREAAVAWIATEGSRRDTGSSLDLAVTELGQPEVIVGEVGVTMAEPAKRWCELGFWLFPGVRGEGRATLAVDAFTDWLLNDHGVKRVFARIHPENPRSAAVVERCGFQRAGELPDGTVVWVADQPPPL